MDYEKAFDRVNWCKLLETLKKIGIDKNDRELIKNLYMDQTAVVRIEGVESEPGIIGRGVRAVNCHRYCSTSLYNVWRMRHWKTQKTE